MFFVFSCVCVKCTRVRREEMNEYALNSLNMIHALLLMRTKMRIHTLCSVQWMREKKMRRTKKVWPQTLNAYIYIYCHSFLPFDRIRKLSSKLICASDARYLSHFCSEYDNHKQVSLCSPPNIMNENEFVFFCFFFQATVLASDFMQIFRQHLNTLTSSLLIFLLLLGYCSPLLLCVRRSGPKIYVFYLPIH